MTDQSILKKLCLMLVCLAAFSYTGLADTISTINGTTYDTARPVNADALRFSNPDGMDTNLQKACAVEREQFALCFAHRDQKEGTSAFLEKRKPTWTR